VELLTKSTLRSASGPAADRRLPIGVYRIAFVIGDSELERALRASLLSRPELIESDEGAASVVIADAPLPDADFGDRRQVLLVGTSGRTQPNETAIESLDPSLILAAAMLLAAGYRVVPEHFQPEPVHLSAREKQVVDLLVEGASNKLIARELDISVHTAKFHVTAVLEKLGARNRSDAVAIALREGLVML
jgi:DNA-binding CsgD family transcriptional regulator